MKKVLSLIVASAMILSFSVATFAADADYTSYADGTKIASDKAITVEKGATVEFSAEYKTVADTYKKNVVWSVDGDAANYTLAKIAGTDGTKVNVTFKADTTFTVNMTATLDDGTVDADIDYTVNCEDYSYTKTTADKVGTASLFDEDDTIELPAIVGDANKITYDTFKSIYDSEMNVIIPIDGELCAYLDGYNMAKPSDKMAAAKVDVAFSAPRALRQTIEKTAMANDDRLEKRDVASAYAYAKFTVGASYPDGVLSVVFDSADVDYDITTRDFTSGYVRLYTVVDGKISEDYEVLDTLSRNSDFVGFEVEDGAEVIITTLDLTTEEEVVAPVEPVEPGDDKEEVPGTADNSVVAAASVLAVVALAGAAVVSKKSK